jgi:precorrin-6A/cobalt-precorrin-6A reductase
MSDLLLLAGSFEARRMAEALSAQGVSYKAWLSEAPRGDAVMPQIPRLRRFDSAHEMQEALAQGGFHAVLDASHGFDRCVTRQAYRACAALGLPLLRLERAAWEIKDTPKWQRVRDVAGANALIKPGARVFCATGWDSLPEYEGFRGEVLMLRQTRRHSRPAPRDFVELVFGDPPFSVAGERTVFGTLRVDTLVCRNLGGAASRPKLDAAADLDLEVILIERPAAPSGIYAVETIQSALDWVRSL